MGAIVLFDKPNFKSQWVRALKDSAASSTSPSATDAATTENTTSGEEHELFEELYPGAVVKGMFVCEKAAASACPDLSVFATSAAATAGTWTDDRWIVQTIDLTPSRDLLAHLRAWRPKRSALARSVVGVRVSIGGGSSSSSSSNNGSSGTEVTFTTSACSVSPLNTPAFYVLFSRLTLLSLFITLCLFLVVAYLLFGYLVNLVMVEQPSLVPGYVRITRLAMVVPILTIQFIDMRRIDLAAAEPANPTPSNTNQQNNRPL